MCLFVIVLRWNAAECSDVPGFDGGKESIISYQGESTFGWGCRKKSPGKDADAGCSMRKHSCLSEHKNRHSANWFVATCIASSCRCFKSSSGPGKKHAMAVVATCWEFWRFQCPFCVLLKGRNVLPLWTSRTANRRGTENSFHGASVCCVEFGVFGVGYKHRDPKGPPFWCGVTKRNVNADEPWSCQWGGIRPCLHHTTCDRLEGRAGRER